MDKEGRRQDPEESPSKEGATGALTFAVQGGDNVNVYHSVSAPPKKETVHRRWTFDSSGCCLSPPTFTSSNRTKFSLISFKFEAMIPVKAGLTLQGISKIL